MKHSTPSSVDIHDVVTHLVRRGLRSFDATQVSNRPGLDAETVHELRVSARRLVCEVHTLRHVVAFSAWHQVTKDLKWMGNVLGGLRDLDVLMELFDQHLERDSDTHHQIMRRLIKLRSARIVVARKALASSRCAHMITELHHLSHHPHMAGRARINPGQILIPALWNASCTFLYVVGEQTHRRGDVDLHHVRIAAKKCRYVFEVASRCLPGDLVNVARSLEGIQEVLGQMNDRAVALTFLESLDLEEGNASALQRAFRSEINALNPEWITYFDEARRGFLDTFAFRGLARS